MYDDFKKELQSALNHDVVDLIRNEKNTYIYAICLVTDSDFSTISISLGTSKFLLELVLEEEFDSFAEFSGMVWNPDEWDASSFELDVSKVLGLHDKLEKLSSNEKNFKKYKEKISNIMIDVMNKIDIPADLRDKAFLFITQTDDSDENSLSNISSKILNDEKKHNLFVSRYTKQFDFYPTVTIKKKQKKVLP